MNNKNSILENQKGVALAMALYILIIFVILGLIMTGIMIALYTSSTQQVASMKAYYVAQGGLEYALEQIQGEDDWSSMDTSDNPETTKDFNSSSTDLFKINYDHPIVGAWEFNDRYNIHYDATHNPNPTTIDTSGTGNEEEIKNENPDCDTLTTDMCVSHCDDYSTENNCKDSKNDGFGLALDFDGSNDYIALHKELQYLLDGITITAWIKTNSPRGIIVSYDRSEIFRFGVGSSGTNGRVTWNTDTGTDFDDMSGSTNVTNNNWYFVVGNYTPESSTKAIYVYDSNCNRQEKSTKSFGGPSQSLGDGTQRYGFIGVGSEASSYDDSKGPGHYFNGIIDSVRIFDYGMGEDEISQLCDSSSPVPLDTRRYLLVKSKAQVKYTQAGSAINAIRKIELTIPIDL